MPPVYRMVETAVYSLLNFLPFLVLALYPFRHNLRFSKGITGHHRIIERAAQHNSGAAGGMGQLRAGQPRRGSQRTQYGIIRGFLFSRRQKPLRQNAFYSFDDLQPCKLRSYLRQMP